MAFRMISGRTPLEMFQQHLKELESIIDFNSTKDVFDFSEAGIQLALIEQKYLKLIEFQKAIKSTDLPSLTLLRSQIDTVAIDKDLESLDLSQLPSSNQGIVLLLKKQILNQFRHDKAKIASALEEKLAMKPGAKQ